MLSLVRLFLLVSPPVYFFCLPDIFEGGKRRKSLGHATGRESGKAGPPSVFLSRGSVRLKRGVTIRRQSHTGLVIPFVFQVAGLEARLRFFF